LAQRQGCTFGKQSGSHLKLYLGSSTAILSMHGGSKQLGSSLIAKIKKDLDLKGR